jgi:anti-sigma factor RsiW
MSDDEEKIIGAISDYLDGTLAGAERDEVAKKIDGDPEWKRVHDDLVELRKNVSGMQKQRPSEAFAQNVTSTIHKRSAGRFFARRTLGDRVPFGALLVVAVMLLAVIGYVMWSSQTGSLKVEHEQGGSAGSGLGIAP